MAAYPDRAAERLAPGRYRLVTGPALRLEGGPRTWWPWGLSLARGRGGSSSTPPFPVRTF
jgi:hypothetical protein